MVTREINQRTGWRGKTPVRNQALANLSLPLTGLRFPSFSQFPDHREATNSVMAKASTRLTRGNLKTISENTFQIRLHEPAVLKRTGQTA